VNAGLPVVNVSANVSAHKAAKVVHKLHAKKIAHHHQNNVTVNINNSIIANILAAAQKKAASIVAKAKVRAHHAHHVNVSVNISEVQLNHSKKVHIKHHVKKVSHAIHKAAVNISQGANVTLNISANPTIASILAAAEKQAALIIT
jgi:hypothetical protein